jgi:hypothetical protein
MGHHQSPWPCINHSNYKPTPPCGSIKWHFKLCHCHNLLNSILHGTNYAILLCLHRKNWCKHFILLFSIW